MAEYRKLTEREEMIMIGRTAGYMKEGFGSAKIASKLKRPESEVMIWMGICVKADKAKLKELAGE